MDQYLNTFGNLAPGNATAFLQHCCPLQSLSVARAAMLLAALVLF